METRGPGRPSKYGPEAIKRLVQAVESGVTMEVAAEYAGIGKSTLYRWLDDERPEFEEFRDALTHAQAKVETVVVGAILRQALQRQVIAEETRTKEGTRTVRYAPPDGKLGLEFLARRFPDRWRRREAVELSGKLKVNDMASPERIAALADRVQAALAQAEKDAELLNEEDL